MAKNNQAAADSKSTASKTTKDEKTVKKTVSLEIPLGVIPQGYEASQAKGGRVHIGRTRKAQIHLDPQEAETFLRIREGLLAENERLPNGEPVKTSADVIRWVLSQVIAA